MDKKINIPQIGLGTWQLTGSDCVESVSYALEKGYRHIDTADAYGNHREVGKGIEKSGINRQEIFLTSKLWRDSYNPEGVSETVDRFLDELHTNYLDLLLIHWPDSNMDMNKTLEAMSSLIKKGKIKHIGVSNFTVEHLENTDLDKYPVAVNQVEFHPSLNQKELKSYCDERNIVITAYSPIGRGEDLELEVIKEIAAKHDITTAQVCLAWSMQEGMVVIPKSSSKNHLDANLAAVDVELEQEDLQKINEIDQWNRMVLPGFAEFND